MSPLRRLRYLLEFAGAWSARALIRALPLTPALWLSTGIADLLFLLSRSRRRIAIDNLLQTGVAATPAEAARIARASFRHFATVPVESLKAQTRIRQDNWQTFMDKTEADYLLDIVQAPGRGVILISAHLGNWEVAGQVLGLFKPMVAVARRMNNPYTDKLVQGRNSGDRFTLIPKHEATGAALLEVLRSGKILAMVIDQHTRYRGMLVPFFGRPAATHTAAALMHLRTGLPLILMASIRLGPMRYKLVGTAMSHSGGPRNEAAIASILQAVNTQLETWIRRWPNQYLWAHRRWRPDSTHRARVVNAEPATSSAR